MDDTRAVTLIRNITACYCHGALEADQAMEAVLLVLQETTIRERIEVLPDPAAILLALAGR